MGWFKPRSRPSVPVPFWEEGISCRGGRFRSWRTGSIRGVDRGARVCGRVLGYGRVPGGGVRDESGWYTGEWCGGMGCVGGPERALTGNPQVSYPSPWSTRPKFRVEVVKGRHTGSRSMNWRDTELKEETLYTDWFAGGAS